MKICLIGSTRFKDLYHKTNRALTAMGHIVYTVAFVSSDGSPIEVTSEEKEVLDLVHLSKILESDAVVLVTDETGYYGASTRRELIWAQMNDKYIYTPHSLKRIRPSFRYPQPDDYLERGPT